MRASVCINYIQLNFAHFSLCIMNSHYPPYLNLIGIRGKGESTWWTNILLQRTVYRKRFTKTIATELKSLIYIYNTRFHVFFYIKACNKQAPSIHYFSLSIHYKSNKRYLQCYLASEGTYIQPKCSLLK